MVANYYSNKYFAKVYVDASSRGTDGICKIDELSAGIISR
jgi:hypothetical protein